MGTQQSRDQKLLNAELDDCIYQIKQLEEKPGQISEKEVIYMESHKARRWFRKKDDKAFNRECILIQAHYHDTVVLKTQATKKPKDAQDTPARSRQARRQEPAPSAAEPTVVCRVPSVIEIPREFTVDVTLDPDTANRYLVLSEDGKSVRLGDTRQDLPDTPERFHPCVSVLGAEGFAGGRRYWEVEVGDKPEWDLGVCRESARRKGTVIASPKNGYWVVWQKDGEYQARTSPLTLLSVSTRPSRVGVFLDYEVDEVSFYNVTDGSRLFTFTGTFSGTLRPYFSPGRNAGGTNAAPLIICPAPAQAKGILA